MLRPFSKGNILDNVSGDMRRIVADAMYGEVLRRCTVFRYASPHLIAHIAVEMRVEVHAKGDLIYDTQDPANDLYFPLKGTIMLPSRSMDMYRVGGEPFGLEVIYKKGAPRGRLAVSVTESVLLTVDGDVIHEAISKFSEPIIRWRVLMTNTLLKVARALNDAVFLSLQGEKCDVSLGLQHLDKVLGENALFRVDAQGLKQNNLLLHFKRLTKQKLISEGTSGKQLERLLRAFEPLQKQYDENLVNEVKMYKREFQLRSVL